MKSIVIILAGGKGSRISTSEHKQYIDVNGRTILEHTLIKFKQAFNKKNTIIVIPQLQKKSDLLKIYNKFTSHNLVYGGISRKESVESALRYINELEEKPENILIHDAARPNISLKLIKDIKKNINKKNVNFVIPYTNIHSTMKERKSNQIKTVNRKNYITTQTPQAFKYKIANKLYFNKYLVTDDAELAEIFKIPRGLYIKGENENFKITTKKDLDLFKKIIVSKISFKVGNGFDVHRLVKGNGIMLGGIKVKSDKKLAGHSDGDVIIHALCDSILGALCKKDIGTYFPSSDLKFKDADSSNFLTKIMKFINNSSYNISNVDITIICQAPNLKNYKEKIKKNLLKLTKLKSNQLNVKAKTTDYLGLIGNSKAISCWITTTIKN